MRWWHTQPLTHPFLSATANPKTIMRWWHTQPPTHPFLSATSDPKNVVRWWHTRGSDAPSYRSKPTQKTLCDGGIPQVANTHLLVGHSRPKNHRAMVAYPRPLTHTFLSPPCDGGMPPAAMPLHWPKATPKHVRWWHTRTPTTPSCRPKPTQQAQCDGGIPWAPNHAFLSAKADPTIMKMFVHYAANFWIELTNGIIKL